MVPFLVTLMIIGALIVVGVAVSLYLFHRRMIGTRFFRRSPSMDSRLVTRDTSTQDTLYMTDTLADPGVHYVRMIALVIAGIIVVGIVVVAIMLGAIL